MPCPAKDLGNALPFGNSECPAIRTRISAHGKSLRSRTGHGTPCPYQTALCVLIRRLLSVGHYRLPFLGIFRVPIRESTDSKLYACECGVGHG
jgi:hypothetical protein